MILKCPLSKITDQLTVECGEFVSETSDCESLLTVAEELIRILPYCLMEHFIRLRVVITGQEGGTASGL